MVLEHFFGWILFYYVNDCLGLFSADINLIEESTKFGNICADFDFFIESSKDEMDIYINRLDFKINIITTFSENKWNRAIKLLFIINRKAVTLNILEYLLNFLSHCCKVVSIN